ncbi:MucBP domain-containing protein [Lactobacillus sp. HBUAS51381]|uniref:MucBP domain-containing protein n=1 Tax=Lactobacillus sp. HBUAS51381 TaxID=2722743 RepID=UPI0014571836|nr:MucBP domain-containing protein [Lactobacillus sp. HBUAS51381]NLR10534.1 KxYKxGKxW signal peptide domain-containing protein [Lactobacillus sp. HBUAS51381]
MTEEKLRFKLYKSKTKWVVAGIAMVSLLAVSETAQADQTPQNGVPHETTSTSTGQSGSSAGQTVTLKQTTPTTETPQSPKSSEPTVAPADKPANSVTPATPTHGPVADSDATTPKQPVRPVTPATPSVPQRTSVKPAASTPVRTQSTVQRSAVSGATSVRASQPIVAPKRLAVQPRAAQLRTAVSPIVATTPAAVANDQLVYDNAPIDEWMPNTWLQAILLKTLQGNGGTWNNNFVDPNYAVEPGAKTWSSVADITKSDLLLLKSFSIQTRNSTYIDGKTSYSIEGLQYATNLQSLDLLNVLDRTNNNQLAGYWHGDITDLSPIKNLTNLTFLQFSNNRVSDISALANMKKLTYISAVNNEISDFSMLDATQFGQGGLNIGGQDIWRSPVYLKTGQDTILVSNLGLKLPQNYNAVVGHYGEPAWSAIDVDYWSWYTMNPSVINVYRRGANGTAVGDTQVQFKVVKPQVTPGPLTSSAAGSGIGIHRQPYTYYLVAGYYDATGSRITTYYIPYVTNAQAAAPVTVHYTSQTGATIAPDTVLNDGAVGQTYTATPQTITGYTLDQSKLPVNATGTFSTTAVDVTYVYDQNDGAPVTVTYVDEAGATVAKQQVLTGKYGEAYITQAQSVTGYTLQKVQGPATGTFTDQAQQVVYIYTKTPIVTPPATTQTTVTVHYQTADGTKVAPDVVLTGNVGDVYTTVPATVTGYRLVTTPANAQGTFGTSDSTVTYLYEKVTSGGDGDRVTPEKLVKPTKPTSPTKPVTKPMRPEQGQQPARVSAGARVNRSNTRSAFKQVSIQRSAVPAKSAEMTTLPQTHERTTSSWWGWLLLGSLTIGGWLGLKRKRE